MKGNFSRLSFREDRSYSAVTQVQGGMVTDADLSEEAAIARARADGVGEATIRDGVPETGGAVAIDAAGAPSLVPGTVFADGVRGEVRAEGAFAGPLGLYDAQADFPMSPDLPGGDLILYADVWERTVTPLEDPLLSDPGLHGAVTALRQKTVAQIKWARAGEFFDPATLAETARLPRKGGGVLTVTPVDPETISDPCDPCAETVTADQTVANALFRIEVLEVEGPADAPNAITLGWSSENAHAVSATPADSELFGRAGAVYQFFSTETESHLGVHADGLAPTVSAYGDSVLQPADGDPAPDGGDWPYIRRWNGVVEIDLVAGAVTRNYGSGTPVSMSGREASLTVDAFTAVIDFDGAPIVAGDFWLIELRRFGDPAVRAVSETPIGIGHHYAPLFRVTDGAAVPLTDEENRRLSFPSLANLPATHVGFVNNCPKLYDDAENVQEALDNLCAISAEDIAFDPTDCPRLYDSVDNVQDALINLCKVDFGTEKLLRLLHDWGVVCGAIPSLRKDGRIGVTAGSILDRRGLLAEFGATNFDPTTVAKESGLTPDDLQRLLKADELCITLTIGEGGKVTPVLASKADAFGAPDTDFFAEYKKCIAEAKAYRPSDQLAPKTDAERKALDKVFYGAKSEKLASGQRLDSRENEIARKYNDGVVNEYKAFVGTEEESALVDAKMKEIDAAYRLDNVSGAALETRRIQREAARYRYINERNQERLRECVCRALLPRCPTPPKEPHLVPIGCIEGVVEGDRLIVRRVCLYCCRKQAMSWRMVQYYFGPFRDRIAGALDMICCPPDRPATAAAATDYTIAVAEFTPQRVDAWAAPQFEPQFAGDKFVEYFERVSGRKTGSDYKTRLPVTDLAVDNAKAFALGNGIEVAETIDVSDPNAIAKLREKSVGFDGESVVADFGAVRPGDKIALIVEDGVAVDYVKLEEGPGRLPYSPPTGLKAGALDAARDVSLSEASLAEAEAATKAFEDRVKAAADAATAAEAKLKSTLDQRAALATEIDRATSDLSALEGRREALTKSISDAEASLDAARTERTSVLGDIANAGGQIAELKAERDAILSSTASAREEFAKIAAEQAALLAETRAERDSLVLSVRREAPVTAVVKDEALARSLTSSGVVTVDALATLPDAQLTTAARAAGVNLNTARRIQRDAQAMIERPIS